MNCFATEETVWSAEEILFVFVDQSGCRQEQELWYGNSVDVTNLVSKRDCCYWLFCECLQMDARGYAKGIAHGIKSKQPKT